MGAENLSERYRYQEEVLRKPRFVCSVGIAQHLVNIFSEFNEFLPYFEDRKVGYVNDIPGWRLEYSQIESNPSIIYFPSEETQFYYDQDARSLIIRGRPQDFQDGQVLTYISFWLTEGERQKDSSFTLHSSALAVEDKGILLIGDRGSGKTSIALGLLERYNGELISNDLSIIRYDKDKDLVFLEDGSKIIRLRLTSVKSRFPDLLHFFPDHSQPSWTTKILLKAEELAVKVASEPKQLAGVFTIHLDSANEEPLTIRRMSGIEVQFELYENLSRIIRGSAISVFGADKSILGYMPSLDSQPIHQNRVDLINYLVKKKGIWHVSGGNLDEVCKAISSILKTKLNL